MEIKTFKEVHHELEQEHLFLQRNHDIQGFSEKANWLQRLGFRNSIATKLYKAIADNHKVIQDYNHRYVNYKFILEPQLERICEKYNLYVRNPQFFLGDIPEKNIKELLSFRIYIFDLPAEFDNVREHVLQNQIIQPSIAFNRSMDTAIDMNQFPFYGLTGLIEIAAVKSLFAPEAFKESQARIIRQSELQPKNQVELDPIILCRTRHGRIIITAWGDEANDELVVNQNKN